MKRGSCLCGAVVFDVDAPLRPVVVCHCTQCRKWSGHVWAASAVPLDRFHLLRDDGLRWYAASDHAKRGFCAGCGASLFWKPAGEDRISFAAGALECSTGLVIAAEWFAEAAGDYYTVPEPARMLTGSCLCKANLFSIHGGMGDVTACHCRQCRKTSGHFAAWFDIGEDAVIWAARDVRQFVTPGGGARGFCARCGGSLYFRDAVAGFSVAAGCVDNPTGGRLTRHIFVANKGDYYAVADGLPQEE